MTSFKLDRPATPEESAAIAAAIALQLQAEAAAHLAAAAEPSALDPWRVASRIESLGIVRRIPGKLDLRYLGAPTRERLSRAQREGRAT